MLIVHIIQLFGVVHTGVYGYSKLALIDYMCMHILVFGAD
jgi:hypothetical protein